MRRTLSPIAAILIGFALSSTHAWPTEAQGLSAIEQAEIQREAIRRAVEAVRSQVVQIQAIGDFHSEDNDSLGATTGLVFSREGLILTSSYGIESRPAGLIVTYDDQNRATAKLLAIDYSRRVALLQADALGASFLSLELAERVEVGQTAIAIGKTFYADQANLSVGVVSAVGRLYGRAVQVDAAVSPVNYGGPLIDLQGRLIGLLTPLAPGGAAGNGMALYDSGVGFAVPLAAIRARLERMAAGNDIHPGRLGVVLTKGNLHVEPATIEEVRLDGAADRAGLKPNDRIVRFDARPIATQTDFRFAIGTRDAGEQVTLELERNGKPIFVDVVLGR